MDEGKLQNSESRTGDARSDKAQIATAAFLFVFAAACGMYFGQQMCNPLFTKFVKEFGVSAATIGTVASCFAFTSIFMRFISGPAMDSFSRKKLFMLGMAVNALAYLGYSLSTTVTMVVVFRLIQGVSMAFGSACAMALAADASPSSRLGSGMGIYTMAEAITEAVAPTAGLLIANTFGTLRATFATGAVILLGTIVLALFIKEAPRERRPFRLTPSSMIAKECIMVMAIMFFLQMCYYNQNTWLVIYGTQVNDSLATTIGLYFTMHSGVAFFMRPIYGRLTDKYGTLKVLVPCMVCLATSFWIVSFSTELWQFMIAGVFAGLGYAPGKTVCQILSIKCVGKERRGVAVNSAYLAQDFGKMVSPIISGMVATKFGYQVMWRIMTIPVLIAFTIAMVLRGRIQKADETYKAA